MEEERRKQSGNSSIVSDFEKGVTAQVQKHPLQSKPPLRKTANQRCRVDMADVNEYSVITSKRVSDDGNSTVGCS